MSTNWFLLHEHVYLMVNGQPPLFQTIWFGLDSNTTNWRRFEAMSVTDGEVLHYLYVGSWQKWCIKKSLDSEERSEDQESMLHQYRERIIWQAWKSFDATWELSAAVLGESPSCVAVDFTTKLWRLFTHHDWPWINLKLKAKVKTQ